METFRDWIWWIVAAFLIGLFALSAGCNIDGERWNHAVQEAWGALGLNPDEREPETGFTIFIPGDVVGFAAPAPEPEPE